MSGFSLVLILFAVALLSSGVTCLALWWYYRRIVEPALEEKIQTLLTALGEEVGARVREGVVDGVADLATADSVRRTTEKVASTGRSLVGEGLNLLLGGRPRPPPDER